MRNPKGPYTYQPFPKMVYRGDEYRVVTDQDELEAAEQEGYASPGEDPKPKKQRRKRTKKVVEDTPIEAAAELEETAVDEDFDEEPSEEETASPLARPKLSL